MLKRVMPMMPLSTGLSSLLTSGCNAMTAMEAATIASFVSEGMPPWPPLPCTFTTNLSVAAMITPACNNSRTASPGIRMVN